MIVIAGCVIVRDNKILMVKEAKKKCYGQWNMPAGHVDEFEKITDAAIREAYEETGCIVKLTGVLPICSVDKIGEESGIMIRFTADVVEEDIKFDTEEILDVQWLDIEDVKNMEESKLRGADLILQYIKDFEENKIYPLEIFNNREFLR